MTSIEAPPLTTTSRQSILNAPQSGKPSTLVQVTESQLGTLLSTASVNPALHAFVIRVASKNIRVIHPSLYSEAAVNEELLRRVQSLQTTAANLSKILTKRREEATAKIEEQVSATHADVAKVLPPVPQPVPERRVYPPPLPVASVLGKAAVRVKDTRKRAGRVREVLSMLCENVEDPGDVSCTIAADWSETFEDLGKALSREESEEVSSISPFVTPRSKTRRRIARFAGQMRRLELPR